MTIARRATGEDDSHVDFMMLFNETISSGLRDRQFLDLCFYRRLLSGDAEGVHAQSKPKSMASWLPTFFESSKPQFPSPKGWSFSLLPPDQTQQIVLSDWGHPMSKTCRSCWKAWWNQSLFRGLEWSRWYQDSEIDNQLNIVDIVA